MAEPILVSIAAALAAKSVTSLYELVKTRFAHKAEARAALDAAEHAAPDSPEVAALSEHLETAAREDPAFDRQLRGLWREVSAVQRADHGGVINQITGDVHGKVLQAKDIHGDVSF